MQDFGLKTLKMNLEDNMLLSEAKRYLNSLGYKLELSENNGYNNTVKLSQSGDYYILIIDNIVAKDLNSIQSITIINTDTDESIEIKYGVFSYARDNYNKSSALEQLFDAMLVYNDKAIAWFN